MVNTDYTSLSQKGHIKGDLIYMHIKRSQIHSSFCYIRRVCGRTHNTVLVPHELRGCNKRFGVTSVKKFENKIFSGNIVRSFIKDFI